MNIEKASFVVFHSPQRRIAHKLNLSISNTSVKSDNQVKYLGLIFDSNLNWNPYLHQLSKKVSRGIGVLSRVRYYVNRNILHQLYSSIIYPFLAYGLSIWERAIRAITFSKPDEKSQPLFKELEILKLTDLVILHDALFMYHYYYNLLPSSFANFFQTVASMHSHNTRLASKSTDYINTIKTNYGKFNIRFAAVKVWNHLDESIKHHPLETFKNKVKSNILQSYCSWVFKWSLLFLDLIFIYLFFVLFFFTNNLLCSSFI